MTKEQVAQGSNPMQKTDDVVEALRRVKIELAALIPSECLQDGGPQKAQDWPLRNEADGQCIQNAWDIIEHALASRQTVSDGLVGELEALKFAPSFIKGGKNYAQVSDDLVDRVLTALRQDTGSVVELLKEARPFVERMKVVACAEGGTRPCVIYTDLLSRIDTKIAQLEGGE